MLSIVIPVFNEDKNILELLNQIKEKINYNKEVLIIYDFDEDSTIPVVKDNLSKFKNLNITFVKNDIARGVVNALKKGFNCVKGEYTLVLMADLSDDLANTNEMIKKMDEGFDIVCGSRYLKGGRQLGGGIIKKNMSRIADLTLHFFTRIPTHDATNNFKMYRSSVLKDIKIESTGGFEIAMDITVKAFKKGYKITEIPTTWNERTAGISNFKIWKWLPHYLKWYFYCLFKLS